jgi:hypothetical protein
VSRWLAGMVVVGWWSCTSAATRGVGRFFNPGVAKKNARCPGLWGLAPKAWAGWLSYAACSREGQEEQIRCSRTYFLVFQEDCVPSMNTEPLGHIAISWHKWPVT